MTISGEDRGFIIGQHVANQSVRVILSAARRAGVRVLSKTTVQKVISEFKIKLALLADKNKNKKKKKKNQTQRVPSKPKSDKQSFIKQRRQLVKKYAKKVTVLGTRKTPTFPTSKSIAIQLKVAHNISITPSTVRRDLRAEGLHNVVRQQGGGLDDDQCRVRLFFVRTFRDRYGTCYPGWRRTTDIYKQVVFCDEHYVTANDYSSRTQWIETDRDRIPRESKHRFNTKHVMIWSAIGWNYKSPLIFIDASKNADGTVVRLDAKRYHDKCLVKSGVIRFCAQNERLFMQDGARCHVAEMNRNYLEKQGCKYIDNWPAHSPELNPIESFWAYLNSLLPVKKPDDIEELKQNIQTAYDSISLETINNFICHFKTSLDKCEAKDGRP